MKKLWSLIKGIQPADWWAIVIIGTMFGFMVYGVVLSIQGVK